MHMKARTLWPYAITLLPWFVYVTITFLASRAGPVRLYGLDPRQLFFVRLTALAFYLFNWLSGCYCAVTLFSAARDIPEKKKAFGTIAAGIIVLMVGSMLGTNAAGARSVFVGNTSAIMALTILSNGVFALSTLLAFALFFRGSGTLAGKEANTDASMPWTVAGATAFTLLAVGQTWLMFANPDRLVSSVPNGIATYFLPDWATTLVVLLPYLASYALTMFAVFRIVNYFKSGAGVVFMDAARQFITGIVLMIVAMFLLHVVLTLGPTRTGRIGIFGSLAVIYAYQLLQVAGYLRLATGIRKITAIERTAHAYSQRSPEAQKIDEWEAAEKRVW